MSLPLKYTLKQLSYFVATAECGSFAAAAKRLYIAQPAISSAITKLEDQFGTALLVRHHAQGVTLTPSGKRLLVAARQLVRHAEEFQASAKAEGELIEGDLHVGAYVTLAPVFLPKMVSGFRKEYPGVNFRLYEGFQDELISRLMDGDIDIAFMYDIDLPKEIDKDVVNQGIPYALLPKDHPLSEQELVSFEELSQEPFVLLNISPAREFFTNLFSSRGLSLNITQEASSLEVLRGLIAWGVGVSVLITKPPSDISYDGLQISHRPISEEIPATKICLARLGDVPTTHLSRAFTSYCRSRIERT